MFVLCIFRDMIDWDENITEPPPTKSISIEDLKMIGNGEKNLIDFIPKVMCHSIGKIPALKNKYNMFTTYTGLITIFFPSLS